MDRALGKNLEALAEEDDEEEEATEHSVRDESDDDSDSESDSDDDDVDPGMPRGEPNKFDGLCDGVLNAMALVHVSLLELLELKDELLNHSLPPTLLVNLALISAKVFRSISDMNMPVNELVRLVRVYSTPWEEKSAALKKLHEDYESKQRQLNIAIKRLQLVDAHSKRIAREKRIMNWEKLFSKVTTTKGHGRRWKFLIETIKQKAKMGLEHVQEYTKALEQASDSEDGEEEIVDTTKATESSPEAIDVISEKTEETESRDKDDEEGEDEEDEDEETEEEKEVPTVTIELAQNSDEDDVSSGVLSRSASPKKVRFDDFAPAPVIKPPMRDIGVDTEDPDYDSYLHVRIFCPEDINHRGLKCSVTYGDQMYKTGILDWEEKEEPAPPAEAPKATPRPQAAGRGRSSPASKTTAPVENEEVKQARYEEFMVRLPDEVPRGAAVFDKSVNEAPKSVQIAVHHGQFEEIIAMATLELADLKELDLRTIYLPPPKGDDDVPRGGGRVGRDDDLLSLSDSVDLSFDDDESDKETEKPREDPVKDVDPLPFPLFSLHTGRSDAAHMSCGNLPLILYWGKKRRPPVFNRQVGTLGINEVVYDLTGIDLNTTSKEDLNKDMRDQALSAIEFTPEPQEETVAKTEVDELQKKHTEEMEEMKDSYEKQLKTLLENIAQLEEDRALLLEQQQNMRVVSAGSRVSSSPRTSRGPSIRRTPANTPEKSLAESEKVSVGVPVSPAMKHRPLPPTVQKPKKNFRVGRPLPKWGEALPQDFFDRLRLYEEESKQHMAELNERTLRDIRDSLEKKLAGQHRLSKREEAMYDALKDVCLPALFMPFRSGTVFNPRAHQYFHPTGSTDLRLTQPPSMFQLPPLTKQNKLSVVNLFELSSNFSTQNQSWLMERYIQQQQPLPDGNYNPSAVNSGRPPNLFTQNSQLTDSGLDGPNSAQGNPSLPEQEVES